MAHMNIYEVFSKSSLDSSHSDMCMTNTEMIILPGCVKLSEAHRQTNNSNKNSNKDTNNSNSLHYIWGESLEGLIKHLDAGFKWTTIMREIDE